MYFCLRFLYPDPKMREWFSIFLLFFFLSFGIYCISQRREERQWENRRFHSYPDPEKVRCLSSGTSRSRDLKSTRFQCASRPKISSPLKVGAQSGDLGFWIRATHA